MTLLEPVYFEFFSSLLSESWSNPLLRLLISINKFELAERLRKINLAPPYPQDEEDYAACYIALPK